MKTLLLVALVWALPALGFEVHCKYTGREVTIRSDANAVVLEARTIPTFAFPKELKLHPGFGYRYHKFSVGFDPQDCFQSKLDPVITYCHTMGTRLTISSPEVPDETVDLINGSVLIERQYKFDYVAHNVTFTFQPKGHWPPVVKETMTFDAGCAGKP
jgi:hypothetical protein